jgi:hypothetical protein
MRIDPKTVFALLALFAVSLSAWAGPDVAKLANECKTQGKQKACHDLQKIAFESPDETFRQRAVSELTDQQTLAEIAMQDSSEIVRKAAFDGITDQSFLLKIEQGGGSEARLEAVKRMTDQSLIAKVALGDQDAELRKAAVARLANQPQLVKIAISDADPSVRDAARDSLKDKSPLEKLAIEDGDARVRAAAVDELTNHALLARIATDDRDAGVREEAELTLAELQTATLSVSDRIKANWPKLHSGMSAQTVEKLIGPFPEMAKMSAGVCLIMQSRGVSTSCSVGVTGLYDLKFENSSLTEWTLR